MSISGKAKWGADRIPPPNFFSEYGGRRSFGAKEEARKEAETEIEKAEEKKAKNIQLKNSGLKKPDSPVPHDAATETLSGEGTDFTTSSVESIPVVALAPEIDDTRSGDQQVNEHEAVDREMNTARSKDDDDDSRKDEQKIAQDEVTPSKHQTNLKTAGALASNEPFGIQLIDMRRELQKQMTMMEKAVEQKLIDMQRELQKKMTMMEKAVEQKLMEVLESYAYMFKHPTHPIAPPEFLVGASSSKNTYAVDSNTASSSYVQLMEQQEGKPELLEGDARIHDKLFNSDVGNPGVEFKVVGDTRSTEIDEIGNSKMLFQNWKSQNALSELEWAKLQNSQRELQNFNGIGMARNFCASSEFYITKEARQGDGASMSEPLAQPHSAKLYGSAATTTSQLQTPNAKSRKQEWKNMEASGPSSMSPGLLNSIESSNEAGGSSSPPSGEVAAYPRIVRAVIFQLIKVLEGYADMFKYPSNYSNNSL